MKVKIIASLACISTLVAGAAFLAGCSEFGYSTDSVSTSAPSGVSNGTQLATYSFDLPIGFSAPLGVSQPTRAQFNPADGGDIGYSGNFSTLGVGRGEQQLDLGGAAPSYQACAADTLIENGALPKTGTTFCVVETGQRMAGVTVTSVGTTQTGNPYVTLDVTLWQNS